MANTDIITAVENKDYLRSNELLERSLYQKAGVLLEEKKKQVAARTWAPIDTLPGADEKAKLNASRRKAFKDKMKHLKHGENKEQHEEK
jgi:hypothetical protein